MHISGRITHQPENASYGGFGPAAAPFSSVAWVIRFEVDDRRTRGFRAPHKWECLTV